MLMGRSVVSAHQETRPTSTFNRQAFLPAELLIPRSRAVLDVKTFFQQQVNENRKKENPKRRIKEEQIKMTEQN